MVKVIRLRSILSVVCVCEKSCACGEDGGGGGGLWSSESKTQASSVRYDTHKDSGIKSRVDVMVPEMKLC